MGRVRYDFTTTTIEFLKETLDSINKYQDKIIAVMQDGNCYTIFYEDGGNQKDGD